MLNPEQVRANLQAVRQRIARAASRAGRAAEEVHLIVVTKAHPVETIRSAIEAGVTDIGENYVEEAEEKIRTLGAVPVSWHMVGHIQSRKAARVASNFDLVHSVDSVKLARRLSAAAKPEPLPVLIQANVSGEASKFGLPAWDRSMWPDVAAFFQAVQQLPGLEVRGLMTVPPFLPAEEARPFFKRLAGLRAHLQEAFGDLPLPDLSMGMSADFEVAVEEGATYVRIGTAILGERGPA